MVTIRGPVRRPCGHDSFAFGFFEAEVTLERAHWFKLVPCERCRMQVGWKMTPKQVEASRAARLSEGKACPG